MVARYAYFVTLLSAAVSAAAHDWIAELRTCDCANVSGTVTSQAKGLPRDHGIRVAPSGLFPSVDKPIGSFTTGI